MGCKANYLIMVSRWPVKQWFLISDMAEEGPSLGIGTR